MKATIKDDPLFALIIVALISVSAWLIATPCIPGIARATMHRFHLRSKHYATWAAQFPIPAMYNFANRYRFSNLADLQHSNRPFDLLGDVADPPPSTSPWRYINHFPTRIVTFADGRYHYLARGEPHRFEMETRYGDILLRSVYEVTYRPRASGSGQDRASREEDRGFEMRLVEDR